MADYVEMPTFIDTLESMAARAVDTADIQSYLEQTLIVPEMLERYLYYKPERYTRNLVHKSEAFEILVICWDIGQEAPIHGHEGELCWARVERGKLRFTTYRLVSEAPLRLKPLSEPIDGEAGYLDGPADIHAVENCPAFGAPAASVHVYSRPYAECDIYDPAHGERRRVRLAYDTIQGPSGSLRVTGQ
jgi:predicted metal-dependent enzyme (double-stranded beta helix superfamily)